MAVHAYLMVILLAASIGGTADVPARAKETLQVSADPVLADVDQVTVVLVTRGTPRVEQVIDASQLKARIVQKLGDAGVRAVERETETTPRLVVHVEGLEVPGSDQYVFRVQTALERLVIVPGRGNRQLSAEVWRVDPVMAAAAGTEVGEAICDAVLAQTGVFADAQKAARSVFGALTPDVVSPTSNSVQTAGPYPFVASKSSSVFHRPDCRWAQNISGDNLVGYQTREEAIASGKRPCKSCKP